MIYIDRNLICRDCGSPFLFTAFEQEFYILNGFSYEIERCRECRRKRRQPVTPIFRESTWETPAWGTTRGASCFVCGQNIPTSFAPRIDKPVYCPDCFELYGSHYAAQQSDRNRPGVE